MAFGLPVHVAATQVVTRWRVGTHFIRKYSGRRCPALIWIKAGDFKIVLRGATTWTDGFDWQRLRLVG
jgi:hypothetical protein